MLLLCASWIACDGPASESDPSSAGKAAGGESATTAGASSTSGGAAGVSSATGGASTAGMSAEGGASNATGGLSAEGGGTTGSAGRAPDALGAHPFTPSTVTRGGTITFTNIGAAGWWPRRIDRPAGDAACNYKDGTDTWGAHCCMKQNSTSSASLSPFDQEMVLILKALEVKQLAVYQALAKGSARFDRVTSWDQRSRVAENLWFTQQGAGSADFPGDLTKNDCVGYLSQAPSFACGDGRDYYCPNDPGVLHQGFSGSKLLVFLASMNFDDAGVVKCDGAGAGHPGPWVAFVASELVRDGGRKWNGACNCYSKTGAVGDGCGEINVFEVVMDNNDFSNREFASTGVRSFQAGHVGGSVCKASCDRSAFPADVEVIDACAGKAYERGPVVTAGGSSDGCPAWRRPDGDRYFFILLDQDTRTIQVGVVHPANIPSALSPLLPELPSALNRADIDAIVRLRLPQ